MINKHIIELIKGNTPYQIKTNNLDSNNNLDLNIGCLNSKTINI